MQVLLQAAEPESHDDRHRSLHAKNTPTFASRKWKRCSGIPKHVEHSLLAIKGVLFFADYDLILNIVLLYNCSVK